MSKVMKNEKRNNAVIALFSEDALVRDGLFHLLKDGTHSVAMLTFNELRISLFQVVPPFSRIVIVPSSLASLRLLSVMVHHWPSLNKVVLCPAREIALVHELMRNVPISANNTMIFPLDTPLEPLRSGLCLCAQDSTFSTEPVITESERYVFDPLLSRIHLLTRAECKVLMLLLNEYSQARASRVLQRSMRTISAHKLRALKKLNVSGHVGMHSLLRHPSFMQELNAIFLKQVLF
ncbi:helix-turn-helix transcriptional regulator [Serratia liquefaciens]|uniref:helix-turn-helix transcriptional regulator n=1 Tax=Serratia liquefaciens TaxID=614 RepID=UPI00381BB819